jgi:hypothetical protein
VLHHVDSNMDVELLIIASSGHIRADAKITDADAEIVVEDNDLLMLA